jgi:hypothetical protein
LGCFGWGEDLGWHVPAGDGSPKLGDRPVHAADMGRPQLQTGSSRPGSLRIEFIPVSAVPSKNPVPQGLPACPHSEKVLEDLGLRPVLVAVAAEGLAVEDLTDVGFRRHRVGDPVGAATEITSYADSGAGLPSLNTSTLGGVANSTTSLRSLQPNLPARSRTTRAAEVNETEAAE